MACWRARAGQVFDGSNINAQGNFFGDNSLYFVLNQGQRQAPRGWEVGVCVCECAPVRVRLELRVWSFAFGAAVQRVLA